MHYYSFHYWLDFYSEKHVKIVLLIRKKHDSDSENNILLDGESSKGSRVGARLTVALSKHAHAFMHRFLKTVKMMIFR